MQEKGFVVFTLVLLDQFYSSQQLAGHVPMSILSLPMFCICIGKVGVCNDLFCREFTE